MYIGVRAPPPGPKFLYFHAVLGENWSNSVLTPPLELAPPPLGNPGSATGKKCPSLSYSGYF